MGPMSRLTRISILLAVFFALDKAAGFIRQIIVAKIFGMSDLLDAFNVANNIPDMLYALISGGALAIAFIPVLTGTITQEGRDSGWKLFSRVVNLVFLVTAVLSVVVFFLAEPLVRSRVGVAPGFGPEQQALVVQLMRLNLIGTLIFSVSGLVMAGLQSNQHFLLPALAPLVYDIGQIFGALVLVPKEPFAFGPVTLPAAGLGVQGLVIGSIIGAALHLAVQIPGLIRYKFRWSPSLGLKTEGVQRVLALMGPRLLTMIYIQGVYLLRDNLASRLKTGSVTALTYGWMLMQIPETIIGTTIGTALLPTLSEYAAAKDDDAFHATLQRAVRVLAGITIPIAAVMGGGIGPLLGMVFGFGPEGTQTLLWTTRGFLLGIAGHSLMEVAARSFYARQDARTPLITGWISFAFYIAIASLLFRPLGPAGISLTDSIIFTAQPIALLIILTRRMGRPIKLGSTLPRALGAAITGGGLALFIANLSWTASHPLFGGLAALAAGALLILPWIWQELRLLLKL